MSDINPLDEATPASLDDLFSRDPMGLGEADIVTIITELRRMRKNFLIAEANPKPKRALKAGPLAKEKLPELNLDDLGI